MRELQALADNGSAAEIVTYVKHADRDLGKGFGLKPQNAPKFRERIKQKIAASSEIKSSLHALLQQNRKLRYPAPLSLDFLNLHLSAILHLYGREKVLVSLLLDERKELKEIANAPPFHASSSPATASWARAPRSLARRW
jgi:hypothetical protein